MHGAPSLQLAPRGGQGPIHPGQAPGWRGEEQVPAVPAAGSPSQRGSLLLTQFLCRRSARQQGTAAGKQRNYSLSDVVILFFSHLLHRGKLRAELAAGSFDA